MLPIAIAATAKISQPNSAFFQLFALHLPARPARLRSLIPASLGAASGRPIRDLADRRGGLTASRFTKEPGASLRSSGHARKARRRAAGDGARLGRARVGRGAAVDRAYTVRPGDSLTAIAQHYHVSLQALAQANGLDWRRPLLIGVVLRVPSSAAAPATRWAGSVRRPGRGHAQRDRDSLPRHARAARRSERPRPERRAADRRASAHPDGGRRDARPRPCRPRATRTATAPSATTSATRTALAGAGRHEFAVIGLNGGRPFTANPCFARQWAAAQPPRSVYINTAYHRVLFRHITPDCDAAGKSQPLRLAAQRAYAVGCSEAVAALRLLGATPPLAIWLDVEPGNTWSSRRTLNAATIKGILDHLLTQSPHPLIGVYSNANFWERIVGGWHSLSVPEWIATGAPDPPGCPSGFAAGPVWLSQSTNGRRDLDRVC